MTKVDDLNAYYVKLLHEKQRVNLECEMLHRLWMESCAKRDRMEIDKNNLANKISELAQADKSLERKL